MEPNLCFFKFEKPICNIFLILISSQLNQCPRPILEHLWVVHKHTWLMAGVSATSVHNVAGVEKKSWANRASIILTSGPKKKTVGRENHPVIGKSLIRLYHQVTTNLLEKCLTLERSTCQNPQTLCTAVQSLVEVWLKNRCPHFNRKNRCKRPRHFPINRDREIYQRTLKRPMFPSPGGNFANPPSATSPKDVGPRNPWTRKLVYKK